MTALALSAPAPETPPFSEAAEQAVLSAMILDPNTIPFVGRTIRSESFFRPAHRRIFDAMRAMSDRGDAVDPLTLTAELQRNESLEQTGGRSYIGYLVDVVPSAVNVEHHARIVQRHAQRRQLIAASDTARMMAMREDADPEEIARQLQSDTLSVAVNDGQRGFQVVSRSDIEALADSIQLRGEATSQGRIPGLATGYPEIDDVTQGFRPSEFITIGGVPKAWKSAVAHNITRHVVHAGQMVGIVSAEIGRAQTLERIISADAQIPGDVIAKGTLRDDEWRRFIESGNALENLLHIDDEAYPELGDVLTRCTDLKARHPEIVMIVVDYLQLVTARRRGMTGAEEINTVTRALKGLGKRLGVVIVAPFQCNFKEIDKRDDKHPQVGDVQGASGPIQDADFAILLYNGTLYNPSAPKILELNFAACRRTAPFVARLKMYPEFQLLGSERAEQQTQRRVAELHRPLVML